jgi:hypothetical protein
MTNDECVIQGRTILDNKTISHGIDVNIRIQDSTINYSKLLDSTFEISTKKNLKIINSKILAASIHLTGYNIFVQNSVISASGRVGLGLGSSNNSRQGHAYVGEGASRSILETNLAYGANCPLDDNFISNDDPLTKGSGGQDVRTYGE